MPIQQQHTHTAVEQDEVSSVTSRTRTVLNVGGVIGAAVLLMVVVAVVFWVVIPTVNERRIHSFCEGIQTGENAASVWNRGSSFTRERGDDNIDFSVSLPSLGMRVWHCNVSTDPKGQVSNKTIGCED